MVAISGTKIHQNLLKNEDGARASQHSQGLAPEEAEHAPREGVAQKGLQHALLSLSDVTEETAESDGLAQWVILPLFCA